MLIYERSVKTDKITDSVYLLRNVKTHRKKLETEEKSGLCVVHDKILLLECFNIIVLF